jgi:UDP-glucose 4-epimerase
MKVLVTGSSGTIGTRLMQRLEEEGYESTGVDIRPNKWDEHVNQRTVLADLRDLNATMAAVQAGVDLVIHLAAHARVYPLVEEPALALENISMCFNVLEAARKNKIPKICFASSREVYGNSGKPLHNEDESYVKHCESPYTASKIAGEALVHSYHQCYGLDFIIYRFSNVYGMYDESERIVPLFIRRALKGEPLKIFGKEKNLDFTYIDDAVSGILKSMAHFEEAKNEVYNLAYGEGISLVTVAERVKDLLGSTSPIVLEETRPGEVTQFVADIAKAKARLGYAPQVPFEEGLQRSIEWYKKHLYV